MSVRIKQFAAVAALFAVPALALAAAPDKAEKVAERLLGLDKSVQTIATQLDTTLASMNSLAQPGGDLTAKYKTFTKNIDTMNKMAEKAKSNAASAAAQRDAYIAEWKKSQETIQNPQLKASSEARRAELEPKIDVIKTSLGSARETFTPLMQDLKDLSVFLGNSLNAATVTSASELMAKCTADGEKVKANLATGSQGIKDLAASIKPGGTPTPPPPKS